MRRAATTMQILNSKFREIPFCSNWKELIGTPELSGCWIIWGEASNGKTAFSLQLAKYLSQFTKVLFNSIEEGISKTLKDAIKREEMIEAQGNFLILDKEPIKSLEERLLRRRSPGVIIIDSIQYTGLNKISAKELVDRHPGKLFIFTSHASGKYPEGRTAGAIRYHANVKIRIEGFRAFVQSRYGGDLTKYYEIYKEGAARYWGLQK
jgi:archaellum biogenesis ATPase FlaH